MALAAFAVRSGEETRQMQVVCLDDLVPADDDLRRIEALVDWGQVRRTAEPFYRPGGAGGPGGGPAVVGKVGPGVAGGGWGGAAGDRSGGAGQARAGAGVAGVAVDARDAQGRGDGRVDPAVLGVRVDRAAA